jgi:hypothetical protein
MPSGTVAMPMPRLLIATLALGLAAPLATQAASDPFLGTWKLNLAKSTFTPGPPPKAKTLIYSATAQGILIDEIEVEPTGETLTFKIPYARNGKPTPQNASPAYDMLSVTQPDAHTAVWKVMRKGQVIGSARTTVSPDGRTLTMVSSIKPDATSTRSQHSVFDKQ